MVTTFIYRPILVKIDARNFELSWQQTHKHTTPARPLQTGPITIHCAAKLSVCIAQYSRNLRGADRGAVVYTIRDQHHFAMWEV